MSDTVEGTYLQ